MRFFFLNILILFFLEAFSQDIWPPDVPLIDSVSVYDVNTGSVIISWRPCDSADVAGYKIYRSINALWQEIANVSAPNTSYIDMTAAANFHPELYRIAAYDEVGNLSPMTPENKYHNTIYVFPYLDSIQCHFVIRLSWNKYLNWEENVKEYRIYVSENFGPFTLLDVVNGNVNQYYHQNIKDKTSYCYIIRAISNNYRTSSSNKTCYFTDFPNVPTFINADYATVEDNKIVLSFTLDTLASICRYELRKSTDGINFQTITRFNKCNIKKFVYTDNDVNTKNRYYYKLVALDLCDQIRCSSNIASNIVINTWSNEELQNIISWNRYYNWLGNIDSIYLYRIIDNDTSLIFSSFDTFDTLKYDNLSNLVLNNNYIPNKFCYFVKQVEQSANPHGVKGISKSNISCTYQIPRVFIPNTFTPDGDNLNSTFKPSMVFVEKEDYCFKIFDRWGFLVFETNDITQGWNGKCGNSPCETGLYVYYLKYKTFDGTINERSGHLYLYIP